LGKKALLRKCENKTLPTAVVRLQAYGDRIFVGDMAESLHFVKYGRTDNSLVVFSDDAVPRLVFVFFLRRCDECDADYLPHLLQPLYNNPKQVHKRHVRP
jgi:hypothetical protein